MTETNATNLEAMFNDKVTKQRTERNRRIEEGRKAEEEWLKRTQDFFERIEFLNKYGFGFHISREKESGWCKYPDQHNIYIRSSRTFGYINVLPNGKIYCSCFVGAYDKTFESVEDFVKAMAERIR